MKCRKAFTVSRAAVEAVVEVLAAVVFPVVDLEEEEGEVGKMQRITDSVLKMVLFIHLSAKEEDA